MARITVLPDHRSFWLLTPVPRDKIKSVGNAAGMGALQALLSLDAPGF